MELGQRVARMHVKAEFDRLMDGGWSYRYRPKATVSHTDERGE